MVISKGDSLCSGSEKLKEIGPPALTMAAPQGTGPGWPPTSPTDVEEKEPTNRAKYKRDLIRGAYDRVRKKVKRASEELAMAASRLGQAREAALQAEAVVASNRELQQEATIEAGFPVSVIEAIIMSGPMLTAEAASLREALEEAKIVTKKAEDKVAAALELQQEIMEALAEIMEAVAEGRGRRPGAAASSSAAAAAEEPEGR